MNAADVSGYLALAERTRWTMGILATAAQPHEPNHTARDWLLTMHFYVLVHYLNALAATKGRRFTRHEDRHAWVRSESDLRTIAADYFAIEGWSRDARYEGVLVRDFDDLHVAFRRVRDHLVGLLRRAAVPGLRIPSVEPVDFLA